jgi:pentatricopeptide repeat protein
MKSTHMAVSGRDEVDCKLDIMAYMMAIAGCSEAGECTHAPLLMAEMRREGIRLNVVIFSAEIKVYATASTKLARRHDEKFASGRI